MKPKTCDEFLTAVRLHSKAAEVMAQGSRAVNMIAEEKEKQLQALAASRSGKGKSGGEGTLPTLQQLMKVMQQMQGELLALRRRKGNPGANTDGEPQNSGTQGPASSVERKLICFTVRRRATSEGNAPK